MEYKGPRLTKVVAMGMKVKEGVEEYFLKNWVECV